jgi:indole-3-glycerol phosphate synthase
MSSYLTRILESKQQEVLRLPPPITLKEALRKPSLSVIAEIKRRSPSKGILNVSLDPASLAQKYVAGGAAAISVLTDEPYFGGTLQDLKEVIESCPGVAVLRKEFIIDLKQLYQTARAGAHAVLLIASVLQDRLPEFIREAKNYGLETLVEVHDLNELHLAHIAGAEIIGVNNRNLTTFEVSLETSVALAPHFAPTVIKIAESGIENGSHAEKMRRAGYDAVLVGEALVKAQDPQSLLKELVHAH